MIRIGNMTELNLIQYGFKLIATTKRSSPLLDTWFGKSRKTNGQGMSETVKLNENRVGRPKEQTVDAASICNDLTND